MNTCDHGHDTLDKVRSLPIGGSGNVIICKEHFHKEMAFRKERINGGVPFDIVKWEDLKIYE